MLPHTCILSAFTLSTAIAFGTAATAGDLPKEGTYTATSSVDGTYKATPIGKERVLNTFDENGLSVGSGLLNHLTWHCWGVDATSRTVGLSTTATASELTRWRPSRQQLRERRKIPRGRKEFQRGRLHSYRAPGSMLASAVAISMWVTRPEFRTAAEGTFVEYTTIQGSYKLP